MTCDFKSLCDSILVIKTMVGCYERLCEKISPRPGSNSGPLEQ